MGRTIGILLPAVIGVYAASFAAMPEPAAAAMVSPEETPEALYDEGVAAYRVSDYQTAVQKWERAYALSDNALLLYNIALAYKGLYSVSKDLADLRRARAVIDNFITVARANPDVDVDDAEEKRDLFDEMIREAEAAEAANRPPPPPRLPEEGKDTEPKPINVGDDPGRKLRLGGIVTMAAGGAIALAGGGAALGLALKSQEFSQNLRRDNDISTNQCAGGTDQSTECRQIYANIETWRTEGRKANNLAVITGAVLGGVGVVALIAGGLVYNEGNKRTKLWERGFSRQVRLLPAPSGVVLTGRF